MNAKLDDNEVLDLWHKVSAERELEHGDIIVHSKRGSIYTVLGLSLLAEDCRPMVTYICTDTGVCWTRPLSEFFEEVILPAQEEKKTTRFRHAGSFYKERS